VESTLAGRASDMEVVSTLSWNHTLHQSRGGSLRYATPQAPTWV